MLTNRADNATLLKKLLAAAFTSPPTVSDDGGKLLKKLLESAPKVLRHLRKSTLFEAIHVLDLECPHSDFLAWLLDPLGPLTDNWLLKAILAYAAPVQPWEDGPTVYREFEIDTGRLDILITWSSFKLVIENKVWSTEGDQQVPRYLKGAAIVTPQDGRLLYLSPKGLPPCSIADADERVKAIGYRKLSELVDAGLEAEKDRRGLAFAAEFRDCILRLLKVRYEVTKPFLSESTKISLGSAKRLAEIKEHALEESWDFLQWMYAEAESRLRKILGSEMVAERGKYGVLFRLPTWRFGDLPFGFCFCMSSDAQQKLVAEHHDGPWVGVTVGDMDATAKRGECQPIVDRLQPSIRKVWNYPDDLDEGDYNGPLWREIAIPEDGDLDRWVEDIFRLMEELAMALSPTLRRASIDFAAKKK